MKVKSLSPARQQLSELAQLVPVFEAAARQLYARLVPAGYVGVIEATRRGIPVGPLQSPGYINPEPFESL